MNVRSLARRIALAAALSLLAGCLPLPLPARDEPGSRHNLADRVPDFIVAGTTTRADVALALGEPDRASADEKQFVYARAASEGGVLFVFYQAGGGVETMTYRRLTISFDDAGVVTSARLESATCEEGFFAVGQSGSRSEPCAFPP